MPSNTIKSGNPKSAAAMNSNMSGAINGALNDCQNEAHAVKNGRSRPSAVYTITAIDPQLINKPIASPITEDRRIFFFFKHKKSWAKNISGRAPKINRIGAPHKRSLESITTKILGKQAKKTAVRIALAIPLFSCATIALSLSDSLRLKTSIFNCLLSALVIIPAKHAKINTAWMMSRSPSSIGTPPIVLMKKNTIGNTINIPTKKSTNTLTAFLILIYRTATYYASERRVSEYFDTFPCQMRSETPDESR